MTVVVEKHKMSIEELKFSNINLPFNELKKEIKADFWHYTSMKSAVNIAQNLELWFGSMSNCNDEIEAELHRTDSDFLHMVSFCNSNTEQIPLWYLYSGLKGDGAALRLTPGTMIKFLQSIETVRTPRNKVLYKDVDFELYYGWVYYVKHSENRDSVGVKYKGEWYSVDDWNEFIDNNYFVKDYPWEYEKEFRVIIKNKTETPYERLIVELPNVKRGIDVKCAPNVIGADDMKICVGKAEKPVMTSNLKIRWRFK